jgi:hypothetical protein
MRKTVKCPRRPRANLAESTYEAVATIAVTKRLGKSLADLEALDPQSSLLSEYRALNTRALRQLRRIRRDLELILRRTSISPKDRRSATAHLHLISIVESEFTSTGDTTH